MILALHIICWWVFTTLALTVFMIAPQLKKMWREREAQDRWIAGNDAHPSAQILYFRKYQ